VSNQLPELQNTLRELGATIGGLIWPMFLVCFTDVLNKQDWLELFDFVVLRPEQPWLLLAIIIELLRYL
jgi:hypothetical protein